jgi:hypothetical protein
VCKKRALSSGIRGLPAGFGGLNARRVGWDFHGAPAERARARQWNQRRAEGYQWVGIEPELSMQGG